MKEIKVTQKVENGKIVTTIVSSGLFPAATFLLVSKKGHTSNNRFETTEDLFGSWDRLTLGEYILYQSIEINHTDTAEEIAEKIMKASERFDAGYGEFCVKYTNTAIIRK